MAAASGHPAVGQAAPFTSSRLHGLPGPVRRYFEAALAPGTPLAPGARFWMRGSIRLGRRWLPFRATEVLLPGRGFRWQARAAGVITGSDSYTAGQGAMSWKLLGLLPVAQSAGPDVTRSAAGRAAGEAVWAPAAMLTAPGVSWTARDDGIIEARHHLNDTCVCVRYLLGDDGLVHSVSFDRWGDPGQCGTWDLHPFGVTVARQATFGGVTLPSAGRAGWFYGTSRWPAGEFFRFEITRYEQITGDFLDVGR